MAIDEQIIRQTGKIIHTVHICSPVPYDWDFERNCAVFKSSRLRHWCFVAAVVANITHDSFVLYGSYGAWSKGGLSEQQKIGIYSVSFGYVIFTLLQFMVLSNYRSNHLIINELFRYVREFKAEFNFARPGKGYLLLLRMYRFFYFLRLSAARSVFSDPGNYRLLSSLMPEPNNLSVGVKILFFLVHLELQAIKIGLTFVAAATMFGYMAFATNVIERFRFKPERRHTMGYSAIYLKYNELRILQKLYDQALGRWVFFAITHTTITNILGIYQAVQFSSPNLALHSFILVTLEMALLKMNGDVYEVSTEVQHSWIKIEAPEWFHKWVKSLKPVNVKMGDFFFFDRGLSLTVLDLILRTAVGLIVSDS